MANEWFSNIITPTLNSADDGVSFTCNWDVNKYHKDNGWEHTDTWWEIFYADGRRWDYTKYYQSGTLTSDTTSKFLRDDARPTWKIHPLGPWTIKRVNCWVIGMDETDTIGSGWYKSPDLTIRVPPAPKLEWTVERATNGKVTDLKLSVKKGSWGQAHMDAETDNYCTTVRVTRTTNSSSATVLADWTRHTADEDVEIASANYEQSLSYDQWIRIEAEAYGQGCAGDGARTKLSHVFAWPARPQITRVAIGHDSDVVLVGVRTNASTYHPVDKVTLQRLKDSDKETPSAAATVDSGWTDVMTDTGDSSGMSDNLVLAKPAKGKRTWYRVVSEHDGYMQYSSPVDLGIYQPAIPAQTGAVKIVAAVSGDDGTSAIVDLAWNDDDFGDEDSGDYTGKTRITWGAKEYAWDSTGGVSSFDVEFEDSPKKTGSEYEGYSHTATVYISGLTEGEDVYIRVNRVLTGKDGDVQGPYSEIVRVTPASAPAWVELSAPPYIPRGSSLPLSWTFGSDAAQTGWVVSDTDGRVWGQGGDANGSCLIDADSLSGVDELTLHVHVTTGGNWRRSDDAVTVRIADAPTCSVSVADTVTTTPVEVTVEADDGADVALYVVSRGISYETPAGNRIQYANDIVWSGSVNPGTVMVRDANIRNGATYDVRARATDPETGLSSELVTATFNVAWAESPVAPAADVSASGTTATIATSAVDGMSDSDVYDVYRVTKGGACLVASDVKPGSILVDRYCPFGSCAYRLSTRTANGDELWDDFRYELRHGGLRLDWDGKSVDLPYNVELSEELSKGFEASEHLDGTIGGHWSRAIGHTLSASTDMIRLRSDADQRLVREMARYPGAVFVRTGGGLAFDADVQANNIEEGYSSGAVSVSLSITEIELSDDHSIRASDIVSPEESQEGGGNA